MSLIDNAKEIEKKYCPFCEKQGLLYSLGARLDYELPDAGQWLQCYHCGNTINTASVREQGHLTSSIEKSQYADPKQIKAIGKTKTKDRIRRKAFDYIKDPDVKKEIAKGSKLVSYREG